MGRVYVVRSCKSRGRDVLTSCFLRSRGIGVPRPFHIPKGKGVYTPRQLARSLLPYTHCKLSLIFLHFRSYIVDTGHRLLYFGGRGYAMNKRQESRGIKIEARYLRESIARLQRELADWPMSDDRRTVKLATLRSLRVDLLGARA